MTTLSRRAFLRTSGAAGAGLWLASRARFARADADPDVAPFSLGVASGDPTPDGAVLWTRVDDPSITSVDWSVWRDGFSTSGTAPVGPDGTVHVEVAGLPEPGAHYWYRFTAGSAASAIGRTKTAALDPSGLRFVVASCQDWQQGFYAAWRDIAGLEDVDAVLFLGDYIYEYATYTEPWRVRAHPDGETLTLTDYRARYRLYRSDPDLRAAHRMHPFICTWDDHEVAGDRWWGGAVNHDPDTQGPYAPREAAGVQAFFEYLPVRRPAPVSGRDHVFRSLSFGSLADVVMLDCRTFRSEGVGGTNRSFNPLSNLDVPGISDPSRTILGVEQNAWVRERLGGSTAAWKIVGNPLMLSPLNLASVPDALAPALIAATGIQQLPVTYHRDGIPVNTDQWDGYQPERRALLEFVGTVDDVVFVSGDIHTSWVCEVSVAWGNAPVDEPVAVEFVGPPISSENFNERIGMLTIGRPLPDGFTNVAAPAAIATNRHARFVDFDSNGSLVIDVDAERVRSTYRLLTGPAGSNPVTEHDPAVATAALASWEVRRGSARLRPSPA